MRLLFRFSLVGYLATLLVVFILGAILWEELARPLLFAWFAAISPSPSAATRSTRSSSTAIRPPAELRRWERRFLAGTVPHRRSAGRRSATVLLPDSAHLAQRLSVVMLVTLLITGAVGYYAPHPYAFKITAFVGLVPLALTLGFSGDRIQMFLSGAILLLAGVLPYVHEQLQPRAGRLARRCAGTRRRSRASSRSSACRLQQANDALAEEMVERLKAQQAELIAAQKLRMHVERTPLAVIEWDREHRVTAWNPAAEAIFGFPGARRCGRVATELIVPAASAAARGGDVDGARRDARRHQGRARERDAHAGARSTASGTTRRSSTRAGASSASPRSCRT